MLLVQIEEDEMVARTGMEKLVLYTQINNRILLVKFMCKMLLTIHIGVCWHDYEVELHP